METDIAALFDRDPLSLTEKDLNEIIAYLRNTRQQHANGVKSAGSMKKEPAKKITNLDLSDLGL